MQIWNAFLVPILRLFDTKCMSPHYTCTVENVWTGAKHFLSAAPQPVCVGGPVLPGSTCCFLRRHWFTIQEPAEPFGCELNSARQRWFLLATSNYNHSARRRTAALIGTVGEVEAGGAPDGSALLSSSSPAPLLHIWRAAASQSSVLLFVSELEYCVSVTCPQRDPFPEGLWYI